MITRTIGREDEVRVLGSSAPLVDGGPTSAARMLRYELALEPQQEMEIAWMLLISNAGEEDALARYAGGQRLPGVHSSRTQA